MILDLREPQATDLESYHEIFSDSETHHFIIDEGQQDLEGSTKKLNKLIEINEDKKRIYTITCDKTPTGFIVIHFDDTKTPFISYAIRRSFWKKGVATTALEKLLQIEKHKFDGFYAATHLENKASQRLLQKSRFQKLGVKDLSMGKRVVFEFKYNQELISETTKKEIHDFFRWGLPRTRHAEILESDHWFQTSSPDYKVPAFNEVVFSSVSSDLFEQKVTETIKHYEKLGTGFKWCVTPYSSPSNSKEVLLKFGFKHWTSMMMCQSLDSFIYSDYPQNITIKQVTPDHFESFIDLFMNCWNLPTEERSKMADQLYFDQERTDCKFTRLIAYIDQTPAGVASLVNNDKYGYLHATAVLPDFRGKGAYKVLVNERLKLLKNLGCAYAISGARAKTSGPILNHLGFEKLWDIDMFQKEYT